MTHTPPFCFAPGIRFCAQYFRIIASETSHASATSLTERYFIKIPKSFQRFVSPALGGEDFLTGYVRNRCRSGRATYWNNTGIRTGTKMYLFVLAEK